MEVCVDIDEELLCVFDRAAQAHNITRNTAARVAIAAGLSQGRRDAALNELFDTASPGSEMQYGLSMRFRRNRRRALRRRSTRLIWSKPG
jgi:hypothetical protein